MSTYSIEVLWESGRRSPKVSFACETDAEAIRKARRVAESGYTVLISQGLRPVTAFKALRPAEPRNSPAAGCAGASP